LWRSRGVKRAASDNKQCLARRPAIRSALRYWGTSHQRSRFPSVEFPRGKNNGICHPLRSDWDHLRSSESRGFVDISCERFVGRGRDPRCHFSPCFPLGDCSGGRWIRYRITMRVCGSRSDASSCSLRKADTACPNGDRRTAARSSRGDAQLATDLALLF
jgi:hypothetical protein